MTAPHIVIATNNGDIGGGEVMLLNIAEALRDLGISVCVIGPTDPGDLLRESAARGIPTIDLPACGRGPYMVALTLWRLRHPQVLLWCNGLVPSLATAGIGPRLAHLHQLPTGAQQAAAVVARAGARRLLVPSRYMAARTHHGRIIENWTDEIPFAMAPVSADGPIRVGFLGRLTLDKGVEVLASAIERLIAQGGHEMQLVLAGENRFGDNEDDRRIAAALDRIGAHIEQKGWVERTAFFRDVDLVVIPSIAPESFGLVAAEAMAAGVPVVVSDAGALPDVVGSDHPWIARAGDAVDLEGVLVRALDVESTTRAEIIHRARARWEQRFSPSAGFRRVAELLAELDSPRPVRHGARRAMARAAAAGGAER